MNEISWFEVSVLSLCFFFVALVYSAVGHAGASGYAAVMGLLGFTSEVLRPTALLLNLVVGILVLVRFQRAQLIRWRGVLPFLFSSAPVAFFAARVVWEKRFFDLCLGVLLLLTSVSLLAGVRKKKGLLRSFFSRWHKPDQNGASFLLTLFLGAGIGLLSGITGTGGAIFFTPFILSAGWASPREASGQSIVFVFVNSIFALAGIATTQVEQLFGPLLGPLSAWSFSVFVGALVGSHLGIRVFSEFKLKRILAVVLLVASWKFLREFLTVLE